MVIPPFLEAARLGVLASVADIWEAFQPPARLLGVVLAELRDDGIGAPFACLPASLLAAQAVEIARFEMLARRASGAKGYPPVAFYGLAMFLDLL